MALRAFADLALSMLLVSWRHFVMRSPKGIKLTGKHMIAISKLGRGEKPGQVAVDLGVDINTIYAWQRWPVFEARLAEYIDSVARQELDRGIEDGIVLLRDQTSAIILWMTDVVLGKTSLSDKARWKQALDLLHHAGIIDQQAALRAQANPQTLNIGNLTQDRRQQLLVQGDQEILQRFQPPPKRLAIGN